MMNAKDSIIIVRRKKRKSEKGHASSAWKIAFADFTLSMMAVFLVLWVVSMTTSDQQKIIAEYFNDPGGAFVSEGFPSPIDFGGGGSERLIVNGSNSSDHSPMWGLFEELQEAGLNALSEEYGDTLSFDFISQGIRIQITESDNHPMFTSGGRYLTPYFEDLVLNLAPYLAGTNRPITITGHTDSAPANERTRWDNWDLSSARAHEARRTLVYGGFPQDMVAQISGMADVAPKKGKEKDSAQNRRVEIMVLSRMGVDMIGGFKMPDRDPYEMPSSDLKSAQERAAANQLPRS